MFSITSIIIWLVVGAVAGWLAGQIMQGRGFGVVGNIVVGIVGAGGIGSPLAHAFGRYDYDFALAITLVIVAAILVSEAISGLIRKRIW